LRVSESVEAGMAAVNQGLVSDPDAPFGGIKQSGIGREGGNEGIGEYRKTKYVPLAVRAGRAASRGWSAATVWMVLAAATIGRAQRDALAAEVQCDQHRDRDCRRSTPPSGSFA
jgi:hypothetical protein